MAILDMRLLPDPILRKQAKKVAKVTPQLKKLVENMVETMRDQRGVGLAANQVGSLQKVAVIETPEMEEPMVLINPEIMKTEGDRQVEEGCLSVPGYRGMVNRSEKVRVKAMGLDGKIYRVNADELLAQALEHEIDHLNGILYIDHLVDRDSLYKVTYEPDEEEEFDGEEDEAEGPVEPAESVAAEISASAIED
ncbi:MAG: peptide deformylase [Chloroflexi bacterium]|nr:peptide deformylase [Chloroflexota bacterium]MCI0789362.1 peptide deformylase [Chloroflexota bacterium]MCI0801352.1 peptide deformylase [Chloroflexota bacterium]MCI0811607.1 peptide deformylase [Chloroflexota bacterium]MCI0830200.1 peptide deformylase [Chloroflexota bacterium]